jgi:hypothetical protein
MRTQLRPCAFGAGAQRSLPALRLAAPRSQAPAIQPIAAQQASRPDANLYRPTDSELEQVFEGLPHQPLSNSQSKEDILRLSQAFTAFATELVSPWMHGMGAQGHS